MPYYRSIRCITIALAAMFALAAVRSVEAQQAPQQPAAGVLVLRNGNVLPGVVSRQGSHYRIESEGSVLQIPASQVEMACTSLVDAYEQRRQQRVGNATDAHLELARWCLRHGLLAEAAREILDARTDDPGHPALRTLDLQLQQGLADEASRLQRQRDAVALASHAEPVAMEEIAQPERMIEPTAEVQEKFVRSIQPMLIHGCTMSGCHAPNSRQTMELDRWALEGSGIPTLIRKNLEHVLAQVDVEDPASSPLMRRARQAHGMRNSQLSTPLAPYQTAILIEWLNEAAGVQPEAQLPAEPSADPHAVDPRLVDPSMAGEGEITEAMVDEAAQEMLNRGKAKTRTAFTPRDQFDPEIFNRRQARAKNKKSELAEDRADGTTPSDSLIPETIEFTPTAPASAEESADPPAEATSRD
ncbi:MAG: hypothetical protein C0485_07310 [Pirellula sp.]|nr:hypothetical protein [Pirellula sp.]